MNNSSLRKLWDVLTSGMASWHQGKLFIEHSVAIGHDSLHVIVGTILILLIASVLRRPVSDWRPFLWVFALGLWNEAVDLWVELWPDTGKQLGEGAKDLMLTMIVPTILLLTVRMRPRLFVPGRRKK